MTAVKTLTIVLCGYEIIRKAACVKGAPGNLILAVPICAYLLDTEEGFVLFDTGQSSARLADPATAHATFANDKFPRAPVVLPEHELLPQLAALGVAPADVKTIVLSHAHGDHVGNVARFPHAEVVIQRREHEAAFSEAGRRQVHFSDIASPDIRWRIVDGDVTLMDGLDLVFTPGHSPGHQAAVVRLPSGAVKILVADAADLVENFETETVGSAMDEAGMLEGIRRLNRIAAETGGELVVLHDPAFVHAARLAPDHYA